MSVDFLTYRYSLYYLIAGIAAALFLVLSYRRKKSELTPREAVSLSREQSALFIDLRPHEDVSQGTIPQARHMPASELEASAAALPKDRPLILIGSDAEQLHAASRTLKSAEVQEVYTLSGGIRAWKEEGLPLGKPGRSKTPAGAKKKRNRP